MSIIKYQKGDKIPQDYDLFLKYSETAPENRRPDQNWQYGNPDQYDHYGMWDALGKPKDFTEALQKNPDWQPNQQDNMYHGFSTNPNTGIWLKSHTPGKVEPGNTGWMENLSFQLSGDKNWNPNKFSLIYDPEIKRMRYIEKNQKGKKMINSYSPPPGWKPYVERPLQQLNADNKSQAVKQKNRELQEGAPAQKQIVDQQLTFNNIVNGQLNLNPNAMLYSRPTQTQRNQEVQAQNKSSRLENFARTTQPTITNVMQAEVMGQGMQKLQPYVQKGVIKGQQKLQGIQNKLDNYVPASIDKLIKPKVDLNYLPPTRDNITFSGSYLKDKSYLANGEENFVYRKGDDVYKMNMVEGNIPALKKELRMLHKIDATPTHITAYYKNARDHNKLYPVLKQRYIKGTRPEYSDIQTHMQSKGWKPDQDIYRRGHNVQYDIHPGNFMKDNNGKIHPIDIHIQNKHDFAKYQQGIPSLIYKQGGLIKYKTIK